MCDERSDVLNGEGMLIQQRRGYLYKSDICGAVISLGDQVMVIDDMALPSTLPLPPHPLEPDIQQACTILQNGYSAALDVVNLGRPDLHRVRYHQERVFLELVPLLDAVSTGTSDTVIVSWCYEAVIFFVNLSACLAQCEKLAEHRFDSRLDCCIPC